MASGKVTNVTLSSASCPSWTCVRIELFRSETLGCIPLLHLLGYTFSALTISTFHKTAQLPTPNSENRPSLPSLSSFRHFSTYYPLFPASPIWILETFLAHFLWLTNMSKTSMILSFVSRSTFHCHFFPPSPRPPTLL